MVFITEKGEWLLAQSRSAKDVLLIFARFPEPGKCKTRLIPQLGADGARDLHVSMVLHALTWARELAESHPIHIEVYFDGGDVPAMQSLFGDDLHYTPQSSGDLGNRLRTAFETHAQNSAQRIVAVGTDCPQLTSKLVFQAFQSLRAHETCIAPAADGGYVLIGLGAESTNTGTSTIRSEVIETVFREIPWGTASVLARTVDRICEVQASCQLLPTLSDVDSPDDLIFWEQRASHRSTALLSIIIPTYNVEPALVRAIESAKHGQDTEIIVVAAGTFGNSLRIAAESQVQFIVSPSGRATQLNRAVQTASAEALLFLHADTRLPEGFLGLVLDALDQPRVVAGAFQLRIATPHRFARFVEFGVWLRSRWWRLPYGDQAIFIQRKQFEQLAGFKRLPIMEDYEFVRRVRRLGEIKILAACVSTSPRRWESHGYLRNTIVNQLMIVGYHLGISVEKLAKFYRRGSHKGASHKDVSHKDVRSH